MQPSIALPTNQWKTYLHRTRRPPQHIPLLLPLRFLLVFIHRVPPAIFVVVGGEEQAIWVFVPVVFLIDRCHTHIPLGTRWVLITAQARAAESVKTRCWNAGGRHCHCVCAGDAASVAIAVVVGIVIGSTGAIRHGTDATAIAVTILPPQTPCSRWICSSRSRDWDGRAANGGEGEVGAETDDGVGIGELEGSGGYGVAGCDGGVERGGVGYHGAEVGDGDGDVQRGDAVEEVEVGG